MVRGPAAPAAATPALASIARRIDDHATRLALRKLAEIGLAGPLIETEVLGWLELVKGTCLTWLSSDEPSRDVLQAFLARAFTGCIEAAAAAAEPPTRRPAT